MLGLQTASQTPQNMIHTGQCVLNLATTEQVDAVNRLSRLTGTKAMPELKQRLGYAYEPRKFETAGLTHCVPDGGCAAGAGMADADEMLITTPPAR
jgi:flavin reductase (DIM6/NTAB) family NADH-FMN oxidoreductase RutF